ncbi:MAG: hypothetical protein JW780_06130 [Clostridiales bacterium]|nr:hypothetical protein [Clostridiales bacterium]
MKSGETSRKCRIGKICSDNKGNSCDPDLKLTPESIGPSKKELLWAFILFLTVSLLVLFFSCIHSPFYRFAHCTDANIYMSVARAMRHGLMPYRDVFDHKGILLYLLNYLAAVFSPMKMTGIYLLLSVSLSAFLFYGYRIARLFLSPSPSMIATLLLLLSSVGNPVFYADGGGSTEEYLMSCLMACIFYLIRSLFYAEQTQKITSSQFFMASVGTGFFCGVMLWIKYTMLPAVGLTFMVFYVYLIAKKGYKDVVRSLSGVALGALIISLPCLVFLWANGLFEEMWSVYVVFNYHYAGDAVAANHTAANMSNMHAAIPLMIIAPLGFLYFAGKIKRMNITSIGFISFFFLLMLGSLFFLGRYYPYYFLVLAPFLIFANIAVVHFFQSHKGLIPKDRFSKYFRVMMCGVAVFLILFVSILSSKDKAHKGSVISPETNIEYSASIINSYWNDKETPPKIVCFFCQEEGIFQLCNTYPQHKFFYSPGLSEEAGMQIIMEQVSYIQDESVDFVFTKSNYDMSDLMNSIHPGYRLISVREFSRYADGFYYYVFAKTSDDSFESTPADMN